MAKGDENEAPLTPEEKAALRGEEFMADKQAKAQAEADAVTAAVAAAQAVVDAAVEAERVAAEAQALKEQKDSDRKAHPEKYIGLFMPDGGHDYHESAVAKERVVFIEGVSYEHVAEDVDGIWLYRYLG